MAEANVRVAETVCTRAVCSEALTKIREQSRLAERAALVEQQAAAVGDAKLKAGRRASRTAVTVECGAG